MSHENRWTAQDLSLTNGDFQISPDMRTSAREARRARENERIFEQQQAEQSRLAKKYIDERIDANTQAEQQAVSDASAEYQAYYVAYQAAQSRLDDLDAERPKDGNGMQMWSTRRVILQTEVDGHLANAHESKARLDKAEHNLQQARRMALDALRLDAWQRWHDIIEQARAELAEMQAKMDAVSAEYQRRAVDAYEHMHRLGGRIDDQGRLLQTVPLRD